MAATQIHSLNHRHEQIINWLISNPDKNQGDCARFFNYSEAWLSQVINSDMFQMQYRRRCEEVGTLAVHTIHAKLSGAAAIALDKVVERIESGAASERLLSDTMRTTLQGLGFTAPIQGTPAPQRHLHVHVDAADLMAARERAAVAKQGTAATKALENEPQSETVEMESVESQGQLRGVEAEVPAPTFSPRPKQLSLFERLASPTLDDIAEAFQAEG